MAPISTRKGVCVTGSRLKSGSSALNALLLDSTKWICKVHSKCSQRTGRR